MFEVIRSDAALYYPASRQRKWGGMWEGVVTIVQRDGSGATMHVCCNCRDDTDEAIRDAILDAMLMACDKPPIED